MRKAKMAYEQYSVVDCDGHIVETAEELAEFMDPATRRHALRPARNREGVFPSLDGFHLALHTGAAVLGGNAVRFFKL